MPRQPVLDPQFTPVLQALAAIPPVSSRSVADARAMWDMSALGAPEEVAEVRELTIPVAGDHIAARFYAPNAKPSGLIVFFHGGGWVVGSLDTHDMPLRALANLTGAGG